MCTLFIIKTEVYADERQMRDMPSLLFRLSWTFRSYRAAHTGLPSPVHARRISVTTSLLSLLSQIQSNRYECEYRLSQQNQQLISYQISQYVARLRLLDAGLVEQAHEIANMFPDPVADDEEDLEDDELEGGGSGSKKKGRRGESSAMPAQNAAEFIVRIDKFVKHHLALAKKRGGVKDEYKDGLVYEERKATLQQALVAAKKPKKCLRCAA
jgi:hypothetical protein